MKSSGIFSPAILPCGRVIPNRLVKVAMYEHLADMFGGPPNTDHFALYSQWAKHNWGMIITGNIQVSSTHLTLCRDMTVPRVISEETLQPFRKLARTIHQDLEISAHGSSRSLAIMQLSHAGRQSPRILGGRLLSAPLAPSAIILGSGRSEKSLISDLFHRLLFQRPREMSLEDIDKITDAFVRGAKLAVLAGFDGVQLHAAHGYLISQFISPKTNRRIDAYACNSSLKFLYHIVTSIRKAVPHDFILGVKVSTSDYADASTETRYFESAEEGQNRVRAECKKKEQEAEALGHVRAMASWRYIDFIEISGGDYETPEFMSSISRSPRQAFFARFSQQALATLTASRDATSGILPPLILLTGGLRTPSHLHTALSSQHADLLGIGRASVTCPHLPDILWKTANECDDTYTAFAPTPRLAFSFPRSGSKFTRWIWSFMPKIQLIGAGAGMAWYVIMMRRLAMNAKHGSRNNHRRFQMDYDMGALATIISMWMPWMPVDWSGQSSALITAARFGPLLLCIWFGLQIYSYRVESAAAAS